MATHDIHDSHAHATEAMPSYDDINTPVVVMVGAVSALLTLLSMMFFQGLYYHWEEQFLSTPDVAAIHSHDPVAEQKSLLAGGENHKSIDEAMEVLIKKYQK